MNQNNDREKIVKDDFTASAEVIRGLEKDAVLIIQVSDMIADAFRAGKKVLIMGNGGSAAQATHMAAEFVGRYLVERRGLPAISLTANESITTAISNDYGYESLFAKQIKAYAQKGDIVIGISTSGNSPNVLRGFEEAKELGCVTIALGSAKGGKFRESKEKGAVDFLIEPESMHTPHIQEAHIKLIHTICGLVESKVFEENG